MPHRGRPRTLAYYLPQFHAIPENDAWWGEGFTEWTNVRRAEAQFEGHDQPRVPKGLGYYSLTDPSAVMTSQAKSAKESGVDGFCFYAYWFDGQRLLEGPLDWYQSKGPDFPFCVSWANESWTRRWDGKDHEVLMPQTYAEGFAAELFADFLPYFQHPSYVRVGDKPVFVVHRVDQIPNAESVAREWQSLAIQAGLTGLHLVAAETKWGIDPTSYGFDAVAEFPPVGSNTLASAWRAPLKQVGQNFTGRLLSYKRLSQRFMHRRASEFVRYRGVAPGWDNTARRSTNATIYVGSNPETYRRWLSHARRSEQLDRGEEGLVFINAWNEWAEGAYLEPDSTWGDEYALATRWEAVATASDRRPVPHGRWDRPQLRSLAQLALGSVLSVLRIVRAKMIRL